MNELRRRGINTTEATNAFVPHFIANFNARFTTPPKRDFNAHRPLRDDEHLDTILTWREPRRVTKSLTVQYGRVIYRLDVDDATGKLVDQYVDVYEYPDGRIEIRANGIARPCTPYDKLSEIDQGGVVDHKRLSHVLQAAQLMQADRDNRQASGSPSRTNQEAAPRAKERKAGAKKQREFTADDLTAAVRQRIAQHRPVTAAAQLELA